MGSNLSLDDLFARSMPEPNSGCWLYMGALSDDGYSQIFGAPWSGHKRAWEEENGPVPEGMELHHRCEVRCCINPGHLEPVTHAVNVQLADHPIATHRNGRKTHCLRGHALSGRNLIIEPNGSRQGFARKCAECRRAAKRRRYHQQKETA